MKDFYALLRPDGVLEMRLQDFEHICSSTELSMPQKITLLFGGQDIPQGEADPIFKKEVSRILLPQIFIYSGYNEAGT
jgi:hypothetical protein